MWSFMAFIVIFHVSLLSPVFLEVLVEGYLRCSWLWLCNVSCLWSRPLGTLTAGHYFYKDLKRSSPLILQIESTLLPIWKYCCCVVFYCVFFGGEACDAVRFAPKGHCKNRVSSTQHKLQLRLTGMLLILHVCSCTKSYNNSSLTRNECLLQILWCKSKNDHKTHWALGTIYAGFHRNLCIEVQI